MAQVSWLGYSPVVLVSLSMYQISSANRAVLSGAPLRRTSKRGGPVPLSLAVGAAVGAAVSLLSLLLILPCGTSRDADFHIDFKGHRGIHRRCMEQYVGPDVQRSRRQRHGVTSLRPFEPEADDAFGPHFSLGPPPTVAEHEEEEVIGEIDSEEEKIPDSPARIEDRTSSLTRGEASLMAWMRNVIDNSRADLIRRGENSLKRIPMPFAHFKYIPMTTPSNPFSVESDQINSSSLGMQVGCGICGDSYPPDSMIYCDGTTPHPYCHGCIQKSVAEAWQKFHADGRPLCSHCMFPLGTRQALVVKGMKAIARSKQHIEEEWLQATALLREVRRRCDAPRITAARSRGFSTGLLAQRVFELQKARKWVLRMERLRPYETALQKVNEYTEQMLPFVQALEDDPRFENVPFHVPNPMTFAGFLDTLLTLLSKDDFALMQAAEGALDIFIEWFSEFLVRLSDTGSFPLNMQSDFLWKASASGYNFGIDTSEDIISFFYNKFRLIHFKSVYGVSGALDKLGVRRLNSRLDSGWFCAEESVWIGGIERRTKYLVIYYMRVLPEKWRRREKLDRAVGHVHIFSGICI